MKKNEPFRELLYPTLKKILRIMRIAVILLLFGLLQTQANNAWSQKTKLSVNFSNTELVNVLDQIENDTEFLFLYNEKLIDPARKVSIHVQDQGIEEVLQLLFADTDVKYSILDRKIILSPIENAGTTRQQKSVSGKVTDTSGAPLPGVSVVIKGTSTGTITDIDGKYSLANLPDNTILVFSFVGMKMQEIKVAGNASLNVQLKEEIYGIDEVVAVGYGTVRKSDITGSVSSVNPDDLLKRPATNINQVLQGRAAGVQIKQTQNAPGGDISIRVRGINSYMGSSTPLYVIDGIVGGNINTISPSDIQSIEILKDASSTAIYGANGANGVVLITTKSGDDENLSISFNGQYGWQKIAKKMDLLNAREWAEIDNERSKLLGLTPIWDLNNLPANTDWQDVVYDVAPVQSYDLSSRGGKKVRYYASLNYVDQEGIIDNTDYQRYGFRINLDADISDRIKIGSRLGVSRLINNRMQDEDSYNSKGPAAWVLQLPPVISPYDESGNLKPDLELPTATGSSTFFMNPLHYQTNLIDRQYRTGISGSVFAEIEILEGLYFKPSFNYGLGAAKNGYYKSSKMYHTNLGYQTEASVSSSDSYNWHSDLLLNYAKSFNNGHSINLLGGFIVYKNYQESMSASARDFALDIFDYHQLSAGAVRSSVGSGLSEKKELAYIARVNYDYQNKYLFTFNSRYDGSSIFGVNNKWGFFPSAAVAWKLSEESFIKNMGLFYNLKVRASYGLSGSEALGAYSSHARLSSYNAYNINSSQVIGYRPTSLAVPDLRWEEVSQLDLGLEASFLKGRLALVMDYYQKETSNLFFEVPVPSTSGVSSVTRNTGNLENKGLEININAVISDGKFGWVSDLNIAFQKQNVTNIGTLDEIIKEAGEGGTLQIKVGQPLGSFYGLKENGLWQISDLEGLEKMPKLYGNNVRPGDIRYVDQNNDDDITDLDRVVIGKALPKFFGGWNNTFSFKQFDASVFFDYVYGNDILNADRYHTLAPVRATTNKIKEFKNYWTPENPSATVPRIDSNMGYYFSDGMWIEDGSYLRLREVSLGYSLPSGVLSKMKRIEKLHVYISATNLFTLTNYTGVNPDIDAGGGAPGIFNVEFGGYPTYKTFTLGFNIIF